MYRRFVFAISAILIIAGCSAGKMSIKKEEYAKVKRVAVVLYSTPSSITMKSNPRETDNSIVLSMMGVDGDGDKAATLAHETFVETLNNQGLGFTTISAADTRSNPKVAALYTQQKAPEKKAETPKAEGLFGSMMAKVKDAVGDHMANRSSGPEGLKNFGLAADWSKGKAVVGSVGEMDYIKQTIAALDVDAALIINDPGFSFVCEFCAGNSGAASTGSAFLAAMVDRNGNQILTMREWFATTDAQAMMSAGVVNPLQHDHLFKEHGRKMAVVFADYLKENMPK